MIYDGAWKNWISAKPLERKMKKSDLQKKLEYLQMDCKNAHRLIKEKSERIMELRDENLNLRKMCKELISKLETVTYVSDRFGEMKNTYADLYPSLARN